MADSVYKTLGSIRSAVLADFKESTNSTIVDLVDRWINQGQEEVIFRHKRDFLNQTFTFDMQGDVGLTGTVTNAGVSMTYTTTSTMPVSNTIREYSVRVTGHDEVYKVSSYTTAAITLASIYKGDTSTSASITFFQSALFIDSDIRSIHKVYHDYYSAPMENKGPEDLNDITRVDPANLNYASYWTLYAYNSAYNQRRLVVYPYPDRAYTLKMDGNRFIPVLDDASDEPLIPLQHRQLLYHYAKRELAKYHGDSMAFQIADADFARWLAGFDGEFMPERDLPRIWVDNTRWIGRSRNKKRTVKVE